MMSNNNFYHFWQTLLIDFERSWVDVHKHDVYKSAVSSFKEQTKHMSSDDILNYIDYLMTQELSSVYHQKEALEDFKTYLKSQKAIIQQQNAKEVREKQEAKLNLIDILNRNTYLDIIQEIRNLEKVSLDTYIKERLMPLRNKYPQFIETLYKDINYVLDGIDEDGDNDLMIKNGSLVVENGGIKLTGYQTRLHDISHWLHTQICEEIMSGDPMVFISKMEDFEKFFLFKPTYTPEYKAKLELIKKSIKQERDCNFDSRKEINFMTDKEILDYIDIAISSFEKIKEMVQGIMINNEPDNKLIALQDKAADAIGALNPVLDKISKRVINFGNPSKKVDVFKESIAANSMLEILLLDKAIAELKTVRGQIKKHGFEGSSKSNISEKLSNMNDKKVFIVHGHNELIKEKTARTLEKLGLKAIILHEQPNGGKTIIEKLEKNCSDVGFAVILLTADDEGQSKKDKILRDRARQNVIFEMGLFIGLLGRERVMLLRENNVEEPGDVGSVVYTPIDNVGLWRNELCKELRAVGYSVSADNL